MKQYSRIISLAGGVLALFSFALPWAEDYSGCELANISSHHDNDVGFVLLVFITTLIIIVTSLVLNRRTHIKVMISKIIVTICSGIGLFCFIILFFGERWDFKIYSNYVDEIHYGAFLNAVGYIIAIVGIWDHPKSGNLSDFND